MKTKEENKDFVIDRIWSWPWLLVALGRKGGEAEVVDANNFYEYWSLFPQHWAGFVIFTTVDPTITERATITRQDWGGLLHLHHLAQKKLQLFPAISNFILPQGLCGGRNVFQARVWGAKIEIPWQLSARIGMRGWWYFDGALQLYVCILCTECIRIAGTCT